MKKKIHFFLFEDMSRRQEEIFKRREEIETEENKKLWMQLHESYERLKNASQNHEDAYYTKQENIIAQNGAFDKVITGIIICDFKIKGGGIFFWSKK